MNVKDFFLKLAKGIFPKSRWGNVAYLIVGTIIGNWDNIAAFVKSILAAAGN